MSQSPPPIAPPEIGGESRNRAVWIGLAVGFVAVLLLLLIFFATPRLLSSIEGNGSQTAQSTGNDEGQSDPSDDGNTDSEQKVGDVGEDAVETEPTPNVEQPEPQDSTSPAMQSNNTSDISATSNNQPEPPMNSVVSDSIKSRVRNLNVRGSGEITGLSPGSGNPLRVGSDVTSVVYVIDRSGSMSGAPFKSVSAALCDAIDVLTKDQRFSVILFSNQPQFVGPDHLTQASEEHKASIKAVLKRTGIDGGTVPFPAIKLAIDLRPDAIILLSDGEFSLMDVQQTRQYNHRHQQPVTIHCIGLERQIESLQRLARENGYGEYVSASSRATP